MISKLFGAREPAKKNLDFRAEYPKHVLGQYTMNHGVTHINELQRSARIANEYKGYHHFQNPGTLLQYTADAQGRGQSKYSVHGPNNWQQWVDTDTADFLSAVDDAKISLLLRNEHLLGTAPDLYRATMPHRNYMISSSLSNSVINEDGQRVGEPHPGPIMQIRYAPPPEVPVAPPLP
jgi:hypothetical protein